MQNFIQRAKAIHGEKYNYSKTEYIKWQTPVEIFCKTHGRFYQTPKNHLKGNGCQQCGWNVVSLDDFVSRAKSVHGEETYDYSNAILHGMAKKITIRCKKHGEYTQIAHAHLSGRGCRKCGERRCADKINKNSNFFIEKAKSIHGDRYDYSQSEYINAKSPITVICKEHGAFTQRAYGHLSGNGCPYCQGVIRTTERFIDLARRVHGDRFTYEEAVYKNSRSKIKITCKDHGAFSITTSDFLRGSGCRGCMVSYPEHNWLNSLNVGKRQHRIKTTSRDYVVVDGFDPNTNTIFEFYGDFWHGNPAVYPSSEVNPIRKKTFGELYEITMTREKLLIDLGFKIISIWENDWNKSQILNL